MVSKGRAVIMAAFVGLGALMAFFFYYGDSFQPTLQKVDIQLQTVKVLSVDKIKNHASLEIDYLLVNPTPVTTTISVIDYEIYANGKDIGEGHYSVEDIPEAGRPALFPGGNTTVPDTFQLVDSDNISDVYNSIIKGESVKYEVKGTVTIESTLTSIQKDFDSFLG